MVMAIYLIRRSVGIADVADLGRETASVRTAASAMTAAGQAVSVRHGTYVPTDETCLWVMDADDANTIVAALRLAGVPAARVLPALDL